MAIPKRSREQIRAEPRTFLGEHVGHQVVDGEPVFVLPHELSDAVVDELLDLARGVGTYVSPRR